MCSSHNDILDAAERGEIRSPALPNEVEKSPTSTSTTSFPKFQSPLSSRVFSRGIKIGKFRKWALSAWDSFLPPRPSGEPEPQRPMAIVRNLEQCPEGYPNLAAFLDSDEGFMMYRRFGYLQSRLLLDKQDELRKLEKRLDSMDKRDDKHDPIRLKTRDLPEEDAKPRRELLKAIEERFCEYARILTAAQQLMTFNRPSSADYKSVQCYISDENSLCEGENEWINCREDMVALRPGRDHAWLDHGIEQLLRMFHCNYIERLFCSEDTKRKSSRHDIVYYTRSRIDRLVVAIITLMILILLVIPIYILYHLIRLRSERSYALCVGVMVIFTLAFSAVLSLFTRARRHEILAAAAAYCAVLVVFLGNIGPGTGS